MIHAGLEPLGWDEGWEAALSQHPDRSIPGRVIVEYRGEYAVRTETGDVRAKVPGKTLHEAERAELPAVGDWVALDMEQAGTAVVRGILSRRSKFSRKVAWVGTDEQIVAVNIDVIFIVMSLNSDLNLRRLERYLTLSWESGASPVVVLSKADLADDVDGSLATATGAAPGVPVHAVSVVDDVGIETLRGYLEGNRTVALLGSSGTGKSTLINRLLGEEIQKVQDIRADDKGRHTTTNRELFVLPQGGVVIDTPGMRELQLWDADSGIDEAFSDVASLAGECRFRDCSHEREPGCAVREAVEGGTLESDRLLSYHKLQRELLYLATRQDQRAAANEKRKHKQMTKDYRKRMKL